jgi:hypothetical protein
VNSNGMDGVIFILKAEVGTLATMDRRISSWLASAVL